MRRTSGSSSGSGKGASGRADSPRTRRGLLQMSAPGILPSPSPAEAAQERPAAARHAAGAHARREQEAEELEWADGSDSRAPLRTASYARGDADGGDAEAPPELMAHRGGGRAPEGCTEEDEGEAWSSAHWGKTPRVPALHLRSPSTHAPTSAPSHAACQGGSSGHGGEAWVERGESPTPAGGSPGRVLRLEDITLIKNR